jgi:hypothetical protein
MDLRHKLQQLEEALARSHRQILRQQEIIAELERDGHPAAAQIARATLETFEALRKTYAARRDLLVEELAKQK